MSKILSKDDAPECKAWDVPAVSEAAQPSEAVEEADPDEIEISRLTAQQIEELQQQAYDEAYAEGHRAGLAAGQEEVQQRVVHLEQILHALSKPLEQLDEQVEAELVSLCIVMVRQLFRRQIKIDPAQVAGVVREAVAALPVMDRWVRLHLHPEDAVLVRDIFSLSEDERTWRIVEDPAISRGGCQVLTENSQVDASVETRIAQLIAQVFGGEREGDRAGADDGTAASAARAVAQAPPEDRSALDVERGSNDCDDSGEIS